jgi:hypothetical protein
LTAGRAISATQLTLTTGNLIVASGQGIDFSATAGTGTSELLADYEEGTFTPTLVSVGGGAPTYTSQVGRYTKIGRQVTVIIEVTLATKGTLPSGSQILVPTASLPFTPASGLPIPAFVQYHDFTDTFVNIFALYVDGYGYLFYGQAVRATSSGSAVYVSNISDTTTVRFSTTYFV